MGMNATNVSGIQHPAYNLVKSAALEADHVIKAGAGTVIMLKGFATVGGFVQIHDAAAAPADTAIPLSFMAVAGNDNFSFVIPVCGMPPTKNGIYVCFSTTGPTKTLGGAACWFEGYII